MTNTISIELKSVRARAQYLIEYTNEQRNTQPTNSARIISFGSTGSLQHAIRVGDMYTYNI